MPSPSSPVNISNRSRSTTARGCPFRVLGPFVGCPEEENSFDGGRRIGARDEVEKETARNEKKRREKAGRTCFSTRISHGGGKKNTEQTRRVVPAGGAGRDNVAL